jgi:hypothetical protein
MILADAAKFLGAKAVGAIVTLAVIAGGIWCYRNPDKLVAMGHVIKLTLLWAVIAAGIPWTSYLFMRPLLKFQSEQLSVRSAAVLSLAVIAAYTAVDVVFALRLGDFSQSGTFTWLVLLLGFAAAGVYNFVICESLARHADS